MSNETDTAWLAGLYEGEGCLHQRACGWELVIRMCDRDVVLRAQQIAGLGTVTFYLAQRAGWKDQWRWRVGRKEEVRSVLLRLLPYLGERRRQDAERMLDGAWQQRTAEQQEANARNQRNYRQRQSAA